MTSSLVASNSTPVFDSSSLNNHLQLLNKDFKSSMDDYYCYEKGSLLKDRYKFVSNIQNGSFGKVTLAHDISNPHAPPLRVAVKALKKSVPGIVNMARNEIAIMKQLGNHENICQLVDSFETKKFVILVLEYISEGDLYDSIHNQTKFGLALQNDPVLFTNFVKQLASVINYAHSKNIYHRDIKPENILLDSNGNIKLCDWGLSSYQINCKDFNVGTEKYMAPEALVKDYDYNPQRNTNTYNSQFADYWSFGITLLFTLFGKCAFRKAGFNDLNFSNFIKSKAFLYDYYNSMSCTTFDSIVLNCLNLNPFDRSMDKCVMHLINNCHRGLTIDQEFKYEFERAKLQNNTNGSAAAIATASTNELDGEFFSDFMFEMDNNSSNTNHNNSNYYQRQSQQEEMAFTNSAAPTINDDLLMVNNNANIKPIQISSSIASRSDDQLFNSIPPSLVNSVGTSMTSYSNNNNTFMFNNKSVNNNPNRLSSFRQNNNNTANATPINGMNGNKLSQQFTNNYGMSTYNNVPTMNNNSRPFELTNIENGQNSNQIINNTNFEFLLDELSFKPGTSWADDDDLDFANFNSLLESKRQSPMIPINNIQHQQQEQQQQQQQQQFYHQPQFPNVYHEEGMITDDEINVANGHMSAFSGLEQTQQYWV